MLYYPQRNYWPNWTEKDLPCVIIHYDLSAFGSTFITGVQMSNREMIGFHGNTIDLYQECRDLVRQLEEKKPLPDYAVLIEEFENGEAEREKEAERIDNYYENELLIN